ncbi:sigma-70 family RNA polymerase sigma factor [Peribacillus deserti]|uniref:RNA polymerase factor sigma C n=1 Tax=Peribacillus deserti TaxID=673318 RepID=A0A2N5M9K5_9BACI|nr:sigma-70 family RNA polymerase sigma factor [Peribacillus deserti]PLT31036.1 hypothetical protein CUU66_04320 [Peribacillus deserti]
MLSARKKEKVTALETNEIDLDWIMKEYGQSILWLAYSYVKDKSIAEDITQEVFISCYNHLADFRGEASLKTWLYRITGNRCKDVMKSWSFKSKKITQSLFDDHHSLEQTPEEAVLKRIEDRELSLKVLALPIKYREVIYLHYFEDYKIEEISSLLGIKSNTIKTRLHRGRVLIKDMYERGGRSGK